MRSWFKSLFAPKSPEPSPGSLAADPILMAIARASNCWEHPERAGAFDLVKALKIAEELRDEMQDELRREVES